jgi:hypothetical protein
MNSTQKVLTGLLILIIGGVIGYFIARGTMHDQSASLFNLPTTATAAVTASTGTNTPAISETSPGVVINNMTARRCQTLGGQYLGHHQCFFPASLTPTIPGGIQSISSSSVTTNTGTGKPAITATNTTGLYVPGLTIKNATQCTGKPNNGTAVYDSNGTYLGCVLSISAVPVTDDNAQ